MELAIYSVSFLALLAMSVLMFLQIVVNDVAGIKRRKVPGTMVEQSHREFLFRSTRTVANTNDVAVIYLMLVVTNVFLTTSPLYLAVAAWSFVGARSAFTVCYYANWQTARSISFGLCLLALCALIIIACL